MTNLLWHLRIVGFSLLVLSVAHVPIGKRLGWRQDTARLMPINRQIFYVHTFFICLTLAIMGILCLLFPESLLARTPLGRLVLSGLLIFWGTRLAVQWVVYDSSHWRGQRGNIIVHIVFTILWSYYAIVFLAALRLQ